MAYIEIFTESEFVTEADWVSGFWNYVLGLDVDDLVAELVQNDLDQGATRTVISFEADHLVCEGNGLETQDIRDETAESILTNCRSATEDLVGLPPDDMRHNISHPSFRTRAAADVRAACGCQLPIRKRLEHLVAVVYPAPNNLFAAVRTRVPNEIASRLVRVIRLLD